MNIYKKHFPLLQQKIVYFDNAATTPKPQVVIDAVTQYLSFETANPGRGSHSLSVKSSDAIKQTREKVGRFLNIESNQRIIFTKNSTESINIIANSVVHRYKNSAMKPTLIVSISEHHANFLPWMRLNQQENFPLKLVPILPTGDICCYYCSI
jgi:cysteine desulfurase/selenocysteine lyase